jgi:hypothetical protein
MFNDPTGLQGDNPGGGPKNDYSDQIWLLPEVEVTAERESGSTRFLNGAWDGFSNTFVGLGKTLALLGGLQQGQHWAVMAAWQMGQNHWEQQMAMIRADAGRWVLNNCVRADPVWGSLVQGFNVSMRVVGDVWNGNYYDLGHLTGEAAAEVTIAVVTEGAGRYLQVAGKGVQGVSGVSKAGPASVDNLLTMMNKRPGVKAEYAKGDALEYLNAVEARGSHMFFEDGTSHILLRPDATRWDAMHEWMHRRLQSSNGRITPGEDAFIENFLGRYQKTLKIDPN